MKLIYGLTSENKKKISAFISFYKEIEEIEVHQLIKYKNRRVCSLSTLYKVLSAHEVKSNEIYINLLEKCGFKVCRIDIVFKKYELLKELVYRRILGDKNILDNRIFELLDYFKLNSQYFEYYYEIELIKAIVNFYANADFISDRDNKIIDYAMTGDDVKLIQIIMLYILDYTVIFANYSILYKYKDQINVIEDDFLKFYSIAILKISENKFSEILGMILLLKSTLFNRNISTILRVMLIKLIIFCKTKDYECVEMMNMIEKLMCNSSGILRIMYLCIVIQYKYYDFDDKFFYELLMNQHPLKIIGILELSCIRLTHQSLCNDSFLQCTSMNSDIYELLTIYVRREEYIIIECKLWKLIMKYAEISPFYKDVLVHELKEIVKYTKHYYLLSRIDKNSNF